MVYMDDDVLGWQPLADAWLSERSSAMERKVGLKTLFHSSQKNNSQTRCENFHPITIFENTRCELVSEVFASRGKEALDTYLTSHATHSIIF